MKQQTLNKILRLYFLVFMHPFLLFLFFKFECVELLDCIAGHCAHPIEEYLQLLETLPDLSVDSVIIPSLHIIGIISLSSDSDDILSPSPEASPPAPLSPLADQ